MPILRPSEKAGFSEPALEPRLCRQGEIAPQQSSVPVFFLAVKNQSGNAQKNSGQDRRRGAWGEFKIVFSNTENGKNANGLQRFQPEPAMARNPFRRTSTRVVHVTLFCFIRKSPTRHRAIGTGGSVRQQFAGTRSAHSVSAISVLMLSHALDRRWGMLSPSSCPVMLPPE